MSESTEKDAPLVEVTGVSLKGLGKPLEKLVDSLRAAIGTLYEPARIRKIAEAESEAAVIKTKAQMRMMDLAQRAQYRRSELENRRQRNIESIAAKAGRELPERVSEEPVEEDWIYQFINYAQDIGNERMQRLWSRILAGEVAQPGSFSLRCLRVVADLQQEQANLFTKICSFLWHFEGSRTAFLVVLDRDEAEVLKSIDYEGWLSLEYANLVRLSDGPEHRMEADSPCRICYFDQLFSIEQVARAGLPVGSLLLTPAGLELITIAGGRPDPEYCAATFHRWNYRGLWVKKGRHWKKRR